MDEPKCDCKTLRLVRQIQTSGMKKYPVYRHQCVRCGRGSKFIAADSLPYMQRHSAPEFDEELEAAWKRLRDSYWKRVRDEHASQLEAAQEERRRFYEEYIHSPEWRAIRCKVIKRAGGICEGCGERPAVQAHHTTYEHLGEEFLWELRAVCVQCHERFHGVEPFH